MAHLGLLVIGGDGIVDVRKGEGDRVRILENGQADWGWRWAGTKQEFRNEIRMK